jgi:predicted NBD/HSP70 family sugar kinase
VSQRGNHSRLSPSSIGELLGLIRADGPVTRAQLAELSGISRPTLTQHVETLLAEGLVVERAGRSTGGRPPAELTFHPAGGVVLVAWLGRTRSGLAVADLAAEVLGVRVLEGGLDGGPDEVIDRVDVSFAELLEETGHDRAAVRGLGVGVPWPVDGGPDHGLLPHMSPGWHGVLLAKQLEERFGVPAIVDKDANLAALAEYRMNWQHVAADVVYVKAGAGLGCGIVSGGLVQRGSQGAAGEIGHVWVSAGDGERCPCGNTGCLDTVASGFSLARRLTAAGQPATDGRDVVRLARAGDPHAVRILRDAGRATGEAVAAAVNLLNPAIIVVGGDLSESDELLAGVREVVYQRATAHATRTLRIIRSQLGERAGLVGPAVAVLDAVLAPAAIDAALNTDRVSA